MRYRPFLATLLLLLVTMPALAQKPYDQLTFPALPDFNVPEAERVELPNGMVLFLLEDHELPLVRASARIGVGSLYEPADKVGLAGITGSVMRSGGTTNMTGDEINEKLEGIAASVETFIGDDSGGASLFCLKENVDTVLPIFADVLMHPAFPDDKIALAKTQAKSSISRRNDDAQSIGFREMSKLIYGADSPYARTTEYYTIDAIERDDLVAFHDAYFHPNNTLLAVWGDFDAGAMKDEIQAAFSSWQKAEGFARPDPPPVPESTSPGVYLVPKDDVTQSTVVLGHVGEITRDDPDYPAVQVMNNVLSGGFSGRLMQHVRSDEGLAYSVFGSYSAGYDRPGQFTAGVFTKSESTVQAAESVMRQVKSMQTDAPTDEEMSQAKDAYLNSFVFNFDTRQEIVQRMMTYEYYDYPQDYLQQMKDGIEAATSDDVLRVANAYLKPASAKVLVVGRSADFDAPLSELGEVHEIDVTIPTQPPSAAQEEASPESMADGRALFDEMIGAMGGSEAFAAIDNMQIQSEQNATTPMGDVKLETDMIFELPQPKAEAEITLASPDRFRSVQKMPMGSFTVVKNGDKTMMETPRGTRELPSSQQTMLFGQLWRNLAYLAMNAEHPKLQLQALGEKEVDGTTYEALRVTPPIGDAFTLYLDPGSKRPAQMEYQGQNPMTGAPTAGRDVFSDYQQVSDIFLPFKTVTYSGDDKVAETTLTDVKLNVALDESMFEIQ